jgi:hypothetical protein
MHKVTVTPRERERIYKARMRITEVQMMLERKVFLRREYDAVVKI